MEKNPWFNDRRSSHSMSESFNPSSRKKPKKKEKKEEPSPTKATSKVDSGEERRRRFSKLWKKLAPKISALFQVTVGTDAIFPGFVAYLLIMAFAYFFYSVSSLALLVYIAFILILHLVCRYFYPDNFKRK